MDKYEHHVLPRSFYDRNPEEVAKALLGKFFVRKIDGNLLVGKIVETEAYLSSNDEASHNFKGPSNRNKSLYKIAGHAYVHSMRQWYLLDVVTEGENVPSSVLIRALEPIEGIDFMKKNRKTEIIENLTSGPSRFCNAFEINKELDGIDMTSPKSSMFIADNPIALPKDSIKVSERIGISKATEMPLRFWIRDSSCVSKR